MNLKVVGVEAKNFVSLQHMRREIYVDKRHLHSTEENLHRSFPLVERNKFNLKLKFPHTYISYMLYN